MAVTWVLMCVDMLLMCCGRDWYAELFCSRRVSRGESAVVSWRVSRIMSSVTSAGRGVSLVLVLLVREAREERFSCVSGRWASALFRIWAFAAST